MHLAHLAGLLVLLAAPLANAQASAPTQASSPALDHIPVLNLAFDSSIPRRSNGEITRKSPRLAAADGGPGAFSIFFQRDGDTLSVPQRVTWSMPLNEAHPIVDGWVRAVVTGPSGERWLGREEPVGRRYETGPIRASGFASLTDGDPSLLAAVAEGGHFVLSLEDDRGRRWGEAAVEIPNSPARQVLEDEERARFFAVDPESVPRPETGAVRAIVPLIRPSMRPTGAANSPELIVGQYAQLLLGVRFKADGDAVGPVISAWIAIRQGGPMAVAADAPPFVLTAPDGQAYDGDAAWLVEPCDPCEQAIYNLTRSPDWPGIKNALEVGGNFLVLWRLSPERRDQIAVSTGRPASRNELWARSRARAAALAAIP